MKIDYNIIIILLILFFLFKNNCNVNEKFTENKINGKNIESDNSFEINTIKKLNDFTKGKVIGFKNNNNHNFVINAEGKKVKVYLHFILYPERTTDIIYMRGEQKKSKIVAKLPISNKGSSNANYTFLLTNNEWVCYCNGNRHKLKLIIENDNIVFKLPKFYSKYQEYKYNINKDIIQINNLNLDDICVSEKCLDEIKKSYAEKNDGYIITKINNIFFKNREYEEIISGGGWKYNCIIEYDWKSINDENESGKDAQNFEYYYDELFGTKKKWECKGSRASDYKYPGYYNIFHVKIYPHEFISDSNTSTSLKYQKEQYELLNEKFKDLKQDNYFLELNKCKDCQN